MDSSSTPIKFDIYAGEQLIRTEILTGPTIKVGKLTSLSLRLDDDTVSRLHAQIEVKHPDDVVLLDLGSDRGTSVNGDRVTRTRLKTGDMIHFGEVRVVVTIAGQTMDQSLRNRGSQVAIQPPILDDYLDIGEGRVLEVLALYGNSVIDVEHLKGTDCYTVGFDDDVDCFINPGAVPIDPFPLAEIINGDTMLVNIPNGIDGEVRLDGKIFNLQSLREAGHLRKSSHPNSGTLSLPFKARCRLRLGEFTFLVNAVPNAKTPAPLTMLDRLDPQFLFSVISVAVFSACVLLLVSLIPQSPESLALDRLDALNKFITITLEADEKLEEKKDSGDKGAKKAADDEGKMGKKESIEEDKKFQVKGAETGDPEVIRARKQEVAQAAVDAIFSGIDSGLLDGSESAVALGALEGFTGNQNGQMAGNAFGVGGLGGVGTGMGGGGNSGTSFGFGGLSTIGGGGGRGTGKGYGSGAANVGKRRARKPKIIPLRAKIEGGNLSRDVIRRVIMSRSGAYQNCYERQLASKRDLNGKIEVLIKVSGTTGSVLLSKVNSSSMNSPPVQNCIVKVIRKLRFPAPKNGKTAIIRYPFRFKAGGK